MSGTSTVEKARRILPGEGLSTFTRVQMQAGAGPAEHDVIVVGAGFAGLAAAIEAHNAGASVVVLEKMKSPGGNSIISDGGIAAAGTSAQRRLGIQDSPELMYQDMLRAGLGLNHPALVREVAEHSAEAVAWSMDYLGVEYLDRLDQFGGHSVLRCFTARDVTGATIIRRQVEKLKELGVEIRLQARLDSFLTGADGEVTGVRLREGCVPGRPETGRDAEMSARRGIVLATGGFGADVAFRSVHDPRLDAKVDTTNKASATAEALVEALRIGAMPVHLSHIQLGPWASPDEKGYGVGPRFADYVVFQYGLVVSPTTSSRIVNELGDRKMVADAILGVGQPCIGIADARSVRDSGWSIDRCLEKGVVKTFDSLRDLAQFYGLQEATLTATVERFNGHIAAGADPDFGKPLIAGAAPLVEPPYYAMRLWPKVHHTMGGVQIDAEARVIDLDGNPIPGLYAAGEVAGGVHGACRLGSCAITECLVFGRIAGRNAATASPRT
jgi:flavocytochrome c